MVLRRQGPQSRESQLEIVPIDDERQHDFCRPRFGELIGVFGFWNHGRSLGFDEEA